MRLFFVTICMAICNVVIAQVPILKNIPTDKSIVKINEFFSWGFENNLTLNGWAKTGTAFNNQPISGNTVVTSRVKPDMFYDRGGIGGDYWKDIPYPIGHKGNDWIGTYEAGNFDAPQGTLTSKEFILEKRFLHFLMGGGIGQNIYVALQVKKEDYAKIMAFEAPANTITVDGFVPVRKIMNIENSEVLKRQVLDLKQIALNSNFKIAETDIKSLNITARIVIVDESGDSWGHINVDDFQFTDLAPERIILSNGIAYDKDMPVWGFADTHAHWVNHVGAKGFMHGTTGGNWRNSNVKVDIPPCDESSHGAPKLTPSIIIAAVENAALKRAGERIAGDPGNLTCAGLMGLSNLGLSPLYAATTAVGGFANGVNGVIDGAMSAAFINPINQACVYPFMKDILKHYGNNTPSDPRYSDLKAFIDFPRWNTLFHQQMHITWVRRSYEGGQRLMVVPVGLAKSWEFNMTENGTTTAPKQAIEEQISFLKNLVAKNEDWIEIAYTAKQAREIILKNKMAVVIGLEQAEIGNYGFATEQQEVQWQYDLGIRHTFPIHNIDNKIGGAAVFNSTLNAYNDLVNRPQNPRGGSLVEFRIKEGRDGGADYTEFKFEKRFMRQLVKNVPLIGFGDMPFFEFKDNNTYQMFSAHKNAQGLFDAGRRYINELMKKGMIIDLDHMSDLSQDEAVQTLKANNYSLISGHSNFRELRRNKSETSKSEGNVRTEFTITDSKATEIAKADGLFGIMPQQDDIKEANGCPIPNNAIGGSSSFAQAYWYTYTKTGGYSGIAFGSDFNGFAPQIAPRFGVDASVMMEGDAIRNVQIGNRSEDNQRRQYAFQQVNGIKYDNPINNYHYHRFQLPSFLSMEERDIWEALAIAKSGIDPEQAWQPGGGISTQRTFIQQQKIKNLAHGFRTKKEGNYIAFLDCPEYPIKLGNDCMPERKAAFMVMQPDGVYSLSADLKDTRTIELYNIIVPIVTLWNQFENGINAPLRRSYAYAGGRDFDFNLDGLAHYGMFPDLIQDLKNNGFSTQHLNPLFMGTEQYIKVWEKAEAASKTIR